MKFSLKCDSSETTKYEENKKTMSLRLMIKLYLQIGRRKEEGGGTKGDASFRKSRVTSEVCHAS